MALPQNIESIQKIVNTLSSKKKSDWSQFVEDYKRLAFGPGLCDSKDNVDAFHSLYEFTTLLSFEVKSQDQDKSDPNKIDINQLTKINQQITKIQAIHRRNLTIKKLEEEQEKEMERLAEIRDNKESKEYLALKAMQRQLMKRNITPEAFFRICDTNYEKKVPVKTFLTNLKNFGIDLSLPQENRLKSVLDEEMTEWITRDEYYDALEAYHLDVEKENGFKRVGISFEQKALCQYVERINGRQFAPNELYNMVDVNKDGQIDVDEFNDKFEGLFPDINKKERFFLQNYFDLDKQGTISQSEFVKQTEKAQSVYKKIGSKVKTVVNQQQKSAQQASASKNQQQDDFGFDEEQAETGDQALMQMESDEAEEIIPKRRQKQSRGGKGGSSQVDQSVRKIVNKMETSGLNIQAFISIARQQDIKNGIIKVGVMHQLLQKNYPTLDTREIFKVMQPCVSNTNQLNFYKFQELLISNSRNLKPSGPQVLLLIANAIIKQMKMRDPDEALHTFFNNQDIVNIQAISLDDFTSMVHDKVVNLTETDYDMGFKSIDNYDGQYVSIEDILNSMKRYVVDDVDRKDTKSAVSEVIKGYDLMDNQTQVDNIVHYIIAQLQKSSMQPINVIRMADPNNLGKATAESIKKIFLKLCPNVLSEVFQEALNAFGFPEPNDFIKESEFLTLFDEQVSKNTTQFVQSASSNMNKTKKESAQEKQMKTSQQSFKVQIDENDAMSVIKRLDNILLQDGISPATCFLHADLNHNGVITVDELKQSLQKLLPDLPLSGVQLYQTMQAFDENKNGLIEKQEFIDLFAKARATAVEASEISPSKHPNQNQEEDEDGKRKIPQQIDEDKPPGVETKILEVDELIDLREVFGAITYKEGCADRKVVSEEIKRRYADHPEEFFTKTDAILLFGTIQRESGALDGKKILDFLKKYIPVTNQDYTVELKVIASTIDINLRQTTLSYFMKNAGLSKDDLDTEFLQNYLEETFGINFPTTQGIVKQLQQELTQRDQKFKGKPSLEDFCWMIDKFRQSKPDRKKKTSSAQQDPTEELSTDQITLKMMVRMLTTAPNEMKRYFDKIKIIDDMQNEFVESLQLLEDDDREVKQVWKFWQNEANRYNFMQRAIDDIKDAASGAFYKTAQKFGDTFNYMATEMKLDDSCQISLKKWQSNLIEKKFFTKMLPRDNESAFDKYFRANISARANFQFDVNDQMRDVLFFLIYSEDPRVYVSEFKYEVDIVEFHTWFFPTYKTVNAFNKKNKEIVVDFIDKHVSNYLAKLFDLIAPNRGTLAALRDLVKVKDANIKPDLEPEKLYSFAIQVNNYAINHNSKNGLIYYPEEFIDEDIGKKLSFFTSNSGHIVKLQEADNPLIKEIDKNRTKQPESDESGNINIKVLANKLVPEIEQQAKVPIDDLIDNLIKLETIPYRTMKSSMLEIAPDLEESYIKKLYEVSHQDSQQSTENNICVIKQLVHFIKHCDGKYNFDQVIRSFAKKIQPPVRKYLIETIIGFEDGISKDEFLQSFKMVKNLTDFEKVCLFYDLDYMDDPDNRIGIDTLVAEVCKIKGISKEEDAEMTKDSSFNAGKSATAAGGKSSKSSKDKAKSKSKKGDAPVENALRKKTSLKANPNDDLHISLDLLDDHGRIPPVLHRDLCLEFLRLHNQITDQAFMHKILKKFDGWVDSQELKEGCEDRYDQALQHFESYIHPAQLKGQINIVCMIDAIQQIENNPFDHAEIFFLAFSIVDDDKINDLIIEPEDIITLVNQDNLKGDDGEEYFDAILEKFTNLSAKMHIIKDAYLDADKNGIELIIGDDKVWDRIRFKNIGEALKSAIENQGSEILSEFKDLFEEHHNQLSYYHFNQFIINKLSLQIGEKEFSDLEQYFDPFGMGYIELNDFGQFCQMQEIEVPFEVLEKDDDDQRMEILKQSFIDYEITDEDYFREGCTTILNSEKAALKRAYELYRKAVATDKIFKDKEFGPKNDDDEEGNAMSLYMTGKGPNGYTQPHSIEWKYPSEYNEEGTKIKFFDGGAGSNDVRQGQIGDCWFIGALSVIAKEDNRLRGGSSVNKHAKIRPQTIINQKMAAEYSTGVFPPIFHRFRLKGIMVMRFFKNFKWRYVIIDRRIPCYKSKGTPVFGVCKELNEMWVPLIEKAYAKLNGCYETMISGYIDDALNEMTALVSEKLITHNDKGIFPHKSVGTKEEFWQYLKDRNNEECLMGCSVKGDTECEIMIEGHKCGIMTGHAYGLVDVIELEDQSIPGDVKAHTLLRCRNPWGKLEWNGKWSDDSEEVEKYTPLIEKYNEGLAEDDKFVLGENDGTFLMSYQDWRDLYNRVFVCIDFPDDWTGVRFESEWTKECSGGIPAKMSDQAKADYATNPQYLFECDEDLDMFISLAQNDGRQVLNGEYLKFPYAKRIQQVCFVIHKLEEGQERIETFEKSSIHAISTVKQHRELSMRTKFTKGRYAIVCAPKKKGTIGQFYLSIYFNSSLRNANIQRIDDPSDKCLIIPEEHEKSYASTPTWKIQLVQKSLKYFISDEDNEIEDTGSDLGLTEEEIQEFKDNMTDDEAGGDDEDIM